jgi:hypothetical protein
MVTASEEPFFLVVLAAAEPEVRRGIRASFLMSLRKRELMY